MTPEQNARNWPELVLHPDDRDRCVAEWAKALAERWSLPLIASGAHP